MRVKRGGKRYEPIAPKVGAFLDTPELANLLTPDQKMALDIFLKLEKEFVSKGNLNSPTEQLVNENTKVDLILTQKTEQFADMINHYKQKAFEQGRSLKPFNIREIVDGRVSHGTEEELKDSWNEGKESNAVKLKSEFKDVPLGGKKSRTKRRRHRRKSKSSRRV